MKTNTNHGQLVVETYVFQTKNGAVHIDWGNTTIKLGKDDASIIAYEIPDFDIDAFNKYYK